ncbi:hypothetical protein [Persicitalea jodogahamensis]|uniref:Uncharacterized protein n=1 Tax=Persicitalea jodogahamensis TaxID=402147 RepID=A0A8J3D152_9BACT|nr:hypothetical protein [Persicitalea jodogahamensis]GHB53796.1 hypothetical protein GCM10007390_03350 [Persicitalea jodogahamensis]
MKKHIHFTYLILACSLLTCKQPDRDIPKTRPQPPIIDKVDAVVKVDTVKNLGWLKSVKVEGATEVVMDTVEKTILVTLPPNFTADNLFIDLETHPGAVYEPNSWDKLSTPNRVEVGHFRGAEPIVFDVLRPNNGHPIGKSYRVYVECTGPLTAVLTSDLMLHPSRAEPYSTVQASLELKSGVGTIPEKPGSTKRLTSKLINLGSGRPVQGLYGVPVRTFFIENTTPLNLAAEYTIELEYGEKRFVFPDIQKLKRAAPIAAPYELNNLFNALPRNQEILLSGGYFLANLNYRVKVESMFHPSQWLTAKYTNPSMLTFSLPSGMADGSYLISLYEGEYLVKSFVFNVSNDAKPKGIRSVWTESPSCVSCVLQDAPPRNLSIQKGKPVFIIPFPAILGSFYGAFDPNQRLPDLELKNGQANMVIKAKTRAGSYADATIQLYYGEYTIPTNLASGDYEARLIYEDSKNTIPFWSHIRID